VLVALRDAISREGEHGPFGGVPGAVRVDRGKDFLSRTVGEALGAFAVPVVDLPGSSARPRRGPLPPPRADHYLSLPDAHVMGTAAMNQTLANLGG
jgi:hypothetical protein